MLKGKEWGTTEKVFESEQFSMSRITINPGHGCGMHFHRQQWNGFTVVRGSLIIEEDMGKYYGDIGGPYDRVDRTTLGPAESMACAPGVHHRFVNESAEPVVAVEYYWQAGRNDRDIARLTEGSVAEVGT
jgi:mannose-6-phosphate isomerase-like protein (cupin superfamily)